MEDFFFEFEIGNSNSLGSFAKPQRGELGKLGLLYALKFALILVLLEC